MAVMPPDHKHISEREPDGSWEDCTWDTGLEWYRLVYDARKPATHAEAQLLRRASGEPATGGSNLNDLARGIKVRYGTIIPARTTNLWGTVGKRLTVPNTVAVVQGSMSAFGPLHRLSKFDRNFDGAHAMTLMFYKGLLLWCDPEAPNDADVPVVITYTELHQFVDALPGGQAVFGTIKNVGNYQPAEDTMAQLEIVDVVPKLVDTADNSTWYFLDGKPMPGTHVAFNDRYSPYGATGGYRAIYVTPAGGPKVLALVKPTNVTSIPVPADSTPYSATDLAAAKAAGVKDGVAAEKSRLRTFLGL